VATVKIPVPDTSTPRFRSQLLVEAARLSDHLGVEGVRSWDRVNHA